MNKVKPDMYYIRHLPPKESGIGEIVDSFTIVLPEGEDLKMKHVIDTYPEKFVKPGFYSLLKTTELYHTTESSR